MSRTPAPDSETARAERLAAALRENLKRRKSQAKGRIADAATSPVAAETPNSDAGEPAVAEGAGDIAAPHDKG